jgi:hypothetical protein
MPVKFVVALGETKVAFLPAIVAVSAFAVSTEMTLKIETSNATERRVETFLRLKVLPKLMRLGLKAFGSRTQPSLANLLRPRF